VTGSRPPTRRRRWGLALLLAALVLGGWLAFVGWTALNAHVDIEAGRNHVRTVQLLSTAQLLDGTAEAELAAAHDRFATAVHDLGGPLVAPARLVPWAGRQLRSVTAMATSARDATAMVGEAIGRMDAAVGEGVPAGPERPAALHDLAEAADELRQGIAGLDLGPEGALIGRVEEARAEFAREIDVLTARLDGLVAVGRGMGDLLDGPHRYLVLAANNAEMQNGQGMFLQYGVLETDRGELRFDEFSSIVDMPAPATPVDLDPDLAATWPGRDPNADWRHLGTSARFPATAATAQRLWAATGRPPVDGVISVDVAALRALLALTGPLTVDEVMIDAGSVEQYLLHDQYVESFGTGATDEDAQSARRDRLGAAAVAALDAVGGQLPLDLSAVDPVERWLFERHLMAWSSIPEHQAAFEAAGVAGAVPADGVLASVVNRGSNKLDWFLEVGARIDVEPAPEAADTRRVTLTVRMHNTVDPANEPDYVAGRAAGDYLGEVTVTIPGLASGVTVEGGPLVVEGRDGASAVYGAGVVVEPGAEARVVFAFDVPADLERLVLQPSGRTNGLSWVVDGEPAANQFVPLRDP
jgi:hypothetical protein